jgi:hypothetical protein
LTTTERVSSVDVSNVLSEEKKQQVIALGRLGWSLRRIQRETRIRRETAASYLRSAGIVVREPGWGRKPQAKPAMEVTSDPPANSKPAIQVPPPLWRGVASSGQEPFSERMRAMARVDGEQTRSRPECKSDLARTR